MFARVFIQFPQRNAFFVPNTFVFSGFEGPYIVLQNGQQKIITRGKEKNGQTEIVFDGIENGIVLSR